MLLFLPQMVKQLGVSNMEVGWITMIPYACGAVSMVVCGRISDRLGDRRWSLFWTCVISAIGLIVAGLTIGTWWAVVGMSIAAIGFYGTKGPFWSIPSMWLTGSAAAAGIAWINSIGNLGWVLRAEPRRLGQEPDRQLRRRPLRLGGVRVDVGDGLAVLDPRAAQDRFRSRRPSPAE